MSRKPTLALLAAIAAGVLVYVLYPRPAADTPAPKEPPPTAATAPSGTTIGEEVLAGYADPDKPPAHDLELADRLLFSYRTLVKNHADKPVGTNADYVDALLGDNPAKQVFLPPGFPHLSPGGELLDRWGTPLFVHPEAVDRITLRSAGPDKTMWTADDIVRGPR